MHNRLGFKELLCAHVAMAAIVKSYHAILEAPLHVLPLRE